MTKEQANLIIDAHDIRDVLENEEERDLLEKHNPALLDAYWALLKFVEP
jgi:hypothetical protein